MKLTPIWILCFLLTLGACSNQHMVEQQTKIEVMPDSLLLDPCKSTSAGESVRDLGKAYVKQTLCILQYSTLLEKQREYKQKTIEVHSE